MPFILYEGELWQLCDCILASFLTVDVIFLAVTAVAISQTKSDLNTKVNSVEFIC